MHRINVLIILALVFEIWAICSLVLFQNPASAHPLEMVSRKQVGDYLVELATQPVNPTEDEPVRMDFRLVTVRGEELDAAQMTLQITKGLETIKEAQSITILNGHGSIWVSFPEAGRYVIDVEIVDPEDAEHAIRVAFTKDVVSNVESIWITYAAPITGASILAIVIILAKFKKKTTRLTR